MSRIYGALVLLAGLSTGCSPTVRAPNGLDGVATTKVSGSGVQPCIDEGGTVYGYDGDGDGLTVAADDVSDIYAPNGDGYSMYVCVLDGVPPGMVPVYDNAGIGTDCDDTDAGIGSGDVATYPDSDSDGYGDETSSATMACGVQEGWTTDNTDCDDGDVERNPGAIEVCDNADNDCDEMVDDADDSIGYDDSDLYWYDGDMDGEGDSANAAWTCEHGENWVSNADDCDDTNASVYTGAAEVCDGVDNECDGLVDDGYDVDDDGIADCYDVEVCDGADNDGDGMVDEDLLFTTYYPDGDGDGYGASTGSVSTCDGAPSGYVADNTDCDDAASAVYPGATETWDDTIDQDCDGSDSVTTGDPDPDSDGDGYVASVDCDDGDNTVFPGAPEINDGLDNNCTGGIDEELDNDGLDNDGDGMMNDEVCIKATSGVDTLSAEFYWADYTVEPNALNTTGTVGTGWLCADGLALVEGNINKVNAEVSGGAFWFVMLDANNVDGIRVAGVEYTVGGANPANDVEQLSGGLSWALHAWQVDGIDTGRDLFYEVPALPTE